MQPRFGLPNNNPESCCSAALSTNCLHTIPPTPKKTSTKHCWTARRRKLHGHDRSNGTSSRFEHPAQFSHPTHPLTQAVVDRHSRRRPFAWMRRLANFRSHGSDDANAISRKGKARNSNRSPMKLEPYPVSHNLAQPLSRTSGNAGPVPPIGLDLADPYSAPYRQQSVLSQANQSQDENNDRRILMDSNRSTAPTLATNPETIHSEAGQSRHGTSYTAGGAKSSIYGGGNSVFSSPNHSNRSLTTTLTTIQSSATSTVLNHHHHTPTGSHTGHHQHQVQPSQISTYFSHQYPQTPASAVPLHLHPHVSHLPLTYRSATANNLLTDNASIMTLASSTHPRGRRNSLDTNASIRAIPPTSTWGGSRESLPLSTFSQTESYAGPSGPLHSTGTSTTGGLYQSQHRPSIGVASTERISAYSTLPVPEHTYSTPAPRSVGDGSSGRDGGVERSRNDSVSDSMTGTHGANGIVKD